MTDDESIDVGALLEQARAWCGNPYSCDEEGDDLCEQLREAQLDLEGMLRLCRNPQVCSTRTATGCRRRGSRCSTMSSLRLR